MAVATSAAEKYRQQKQQAAAQGLYDNSAKNDAKNRATMQRDQALKLQSEAESYGNTIKKMNSSMYDQYLQGLNELNGRYGIHNNVYANMYGDATKYQQELQALADKISGGSMQQVRDNQAKAQAEAEAKAQAEAQARAQAEAQARAQAEAEAQARAEAKAKEASVLNYDSYIKQNEQAQQAQAQAQQALQTLQSLQSQQGYTPSEQVKAQQAAAAQAQQQAQQALAMLQEIQSRDTTYMPSDQVKAQQAAAEAAKLQAQQALAKLEQIQAMNTTPQGNYAQTDLNMKGLSQTTADKLTQYGQGYTPGDQVTAAQAYLEQIMNQKPQTYNSKYGAELDSLLQQIRNPEKFNYSFNGDALFNMYKDMYTEQGRQASMDAMGQAAGLTGGYGNTYAQSAGQQQYQQYMNMLNQAGLDIYDRAYQRYLNERQNDKDVYGLMSQAEDREYGRYRDTYNDWANERQYASGRLDSERNFDYNQYMNDRDYWQRMAENEQNQYNTEAERLEAQRQFNAGIAQSNYQAMLDEAYRQNALGVSMSQDERNYLENQRQFNTNLAQENYRTMLDEAYRQNALGVEMGNEERNYLENQRQFNAGTAKDLYSQLMDEAYRRENLGYQMGSSERDYIENQRQFNENLDETKRANDMDYAARLASVEATMAGVSATMQGNQLDYELGLAKLDQNAQQMQQSAKEFESSTALDWAKLQADIDESNANLTEKQRQYNQNLASDYVTSILANGQIPSNELLVAAGLSLDDAQRLVKLSTGSGSGGNGNKNNGKDTRDKHANGTPINDMWTMNVPGNKK